MTDYEIISKGLAIVISIMMMSFIALVLFSGCELEGREAMKRSHVYTPNGYSVEVFQYNGHEYLMYGRGGIIHSESCRGDN